MTHLADDGAPGVGAPRHWSETDASCTVPIAVVGGRWRVGEVRATRSSTRFLVGRSEWRVTGHEAERCDPVSGWLACRLEELADALAGCERVPRELSVRVTTATRESLGGMCKRHVTWQLGVASEDGHQTATLAVADTAEAALRELFERAHRPLGLPSQVAVVPAGHHYCVFSGFAASVLLHELVGHGVEVSGTSIACPFAVWSTSSDPVDALGHPTRAARLAGDGSPTYRISACGFFRRPLHRPRPAVRHTHLVVQGRDLAPGVEGSHVVVHDVGAATFDAAAARLAVPRVTVVDAAMATTIGGPFHVVVESRALTTATLVQSPGSAGPRRHTGMCTAPSGDLPVAIITPAVAIDAVIAPAGHE